MSRSLAGLGGGPSRSIPATRGRETSLGQNGCTMLRTLECDAMQCNANFTAPCNASQHEG
eukprot:276012-Pyramimonas_sp.AAC.1